MFDLEAGARAADSSSDLEKTSATTIALAEGISASRKTTERNFAAWGELEESGCVLVDDATNEISNRFKSGSSARPAVSSLFEALQSDDAQIVKAFVDNVIKKRNAKTYLGLDVTFDINDDMLIALIEGILATDRPELIIELLSDKNSVLGYIITNKPNLFQAALNAIQTTENPVITRQEKTCLLGQVIPDHALKTKNFKVIDDIVQHLFRQGVVFPEKQNSALRDAAQRFIDGFFNCYDSVDLYTIHAIGMAYKPGRFFSHPIESKQFADEMKNMPADMFVEINPVEMVNLVGFLTVAYEGVAEMESLGVKSNLTENIAKILIAFGPLPQIAKKTSRLALLFSKLGTATSALEHSADHPGPEMS